MEKRIIDGILRNSNLERVIKERRTHKRNDKRVIRELGRETEECIVDTEEIKREGIHVPKKFSKIKSGTNFYIVSLVE